MRLVAITSLSLVLVALPAAAQSGRATLRIRAVDSASHPIAGAEITIVKGLNDRLARGTTDSSGRRTLTYDATIDEVGLVARKIGFARADRYVRVKPGDTVDVELVLARNAQSLDAVRVTAGANLRRKSYYIDAEEIANGNRAVVDARDVIGKLRPDMIYGRPGFKACPPTYRVWINGVRIRYARRNEALIASKRMANMSASRRMQGPGVDALPVFVGSILADIKAEHIAEIRYHDCMDFSINRNGEESSIFVVLKPGIGFEQGIGSYVSDRGIVQSDEPELPDSLVFGSASMPSYRYRVLGVYDTSGDPLEGVSIIHSTTDTKALTTATGTVTLVFLPEGESTVRIEKAGYVNRTLALKISPTDTMPLIFLLERAKP